MPGAVAGSVTSGANTNFVAAPVKLAVGLGGEAGRAYVLEGAFEHDDRTWFGVDREVSPGHERSSGLAMAWDLPARGPAFLSNPLAALFLLAVGVVMMVRPDPSRTRAARPLAQSASAVTS